MDNQPNSGLKIPNAVDAKTAVSQQLQNLDVGGESNREFIEILKQIYHSRQEITAISLQQYQALFSELMRDDI